METKFTRKLKALEAALSNYVQMVEQIVKVMQCKKP